MKKTTVYLDASLDRQLSRMAESEGITKAEVIRRNLSRSVLEFERPRIKAIGVGRGPGDVADNADRHLSETDFGKD